MKKHLIWTTLLASGFLAACSQNDDPTPSANEGQPVSFLVNTSVARTTTDLSTGLTNFIVNTDVIGIYSNNVDPKLDDTFTVKAEGALTSVSGKSYYFDGTGQSADFYAFYPSTAAAETSTEGATQTGRSFTVASDQSTLEKIDATDFMTAKQTGSPTNATVQLSFSHRSTLVKLALRDITNVQSVELGNIAPTITWTYADDKVATSGTPTSIAMYAHTAADNNKTYYAIVPAQTVTAGKTLVTITTTDGKTYKYVPTSDVSFKENTQKSMSLGTSSSGDNTLVELSTALEAQWGTQDGNSESGTVEEEIKQYISPLTETTAITPGLGNRTDLLLDTKNPDKNNWGTVFTAKNSSDETAYFAAICTNNNGVLEVKLTNTTTTGASWYNRTLYYYGGDTETLPVNKQLKLTIKAQSSVSASILVTVTARSSDNKDVYLGISSNGTEFKGAAQLNCKTAEETFECYINAGLTATGASTSTAASTANTTAYTYYIGLAFLNTSATEDNPVTYTIQDISLVEAN